MNIVHSRVDTSVCPLSSGQDSHKSDVEGMLYEFLNYRINYKIFGGVVA